MNNWIAPWQQNQPLPWSNLQPQSQPSQGGGGSLGDIVKYLAGANYNFKGQNIRPQQNSAAQIGQLADAQYNQDNPLYQRTYEQERGAGQQDLAGVIAELSRQNRKLSTLGRTPLFDPERGGETVFRGITQGYQNTQDSARARARQILGAGQNAVAGAMNAQNNVSGLEQQNKKSKLQGFGNIADLLPLLGKLF